MTTRPRPRELRPTESYTSLTGVTIAFTADPLPYEAPSSSGGEVRRPLADVQRKGPPAAHAALAHDAAESSSSLSKRFGLVARPKLHTSDSALSVVSNASTTSDLVVLAGDPMPSPFFVPPPAKPLRHLARSPAEPHHDAQRAPSPFPRPESPLPALPSSTLARPPAPPPAPRYPAPPTAHNSLAAFKAAQARADSQGGCSSSTHRTSSDVDLDLSFERAQRDSRGSSSLLHDELVVEAHEHEREGEREGERDDGGGHDWVGIEVQQHSSPRPAVHDIPERDLVRSSSGQLVGARYARATSAVDLRAQFKAAADADAARGAHDVAITIGALGSTAGEWRYSGEGEGEGDDEAEYDAVRRHVIRQGKRPLEGARAQHEHDEYALTAPLEHVARFDALSPPHEHEQDGAGFAYNTTGALWREPPRSAPPLSQPTFADRQQQHQQGHASRPSQSRGFPLPLRLLQQTKRSTEALMSPVSAFARSTATATTGGSRVRAATAGTVADSDIDSLAGASPMFDSDGDHDHDSTVRTAPSTPNDTPLFQDCFDSDDTTPPMPHRLGSSALAGLGLDFGERDDAEARDEFPLVPLRHNVRRVSLPPVAERRRSVRHDKIPSLSISPPRPPPVAEERPSEDGARSVGTSSSTLSSHDSGVDPTVSPSRRLSRRLSLAAAGPASTTSADLASRPPPASRPSVHFDSRPTSFPFLHKTDTPSSATSSSAAGPSIPTPQHLLVSPSPGPGGIKRDPSFSFSPAPLRLVKVQLLRAAGYGSSAESPVAGAGAPAQDARPASPGAPVEATVDVVAAVGDGETAARSRRASPVAWWDDLGGWFQAPSGWVDEVVPAKLAFLAGFLFFAPWLWLLGGWCLRPLDGEFYSQRGTRCRDEQCGCGRIMRGSGSRGVGVAAHGTKGAQVGGGERYAGLDRWVFMNRVAATGGGVGVAVLFGVAVWAAATA
ncbi:hypothetical protein JCM3775_001201 [Rhodotorula graminis]